MREDEELRVSPCALGSALSLVSDVKLQSNSQKIRSWKVAKTCITLLRSVRSKCCRLET